MGLMDSVPWDVMPVEKRRMTAETVVKMSCPQNDSHPMFLKAVPSWSISLCCVERSLMPWGDKGAARFMNIYIYQLEVKEGERKKENDNAPCC